MVVDATYVILTVKHLILDIKAFMAFGLFKMTHLRSSISSFCIKKLLKLTLRSFLYVNNYLTKRCN